MRYIVERDDGGYWKIIDSAAEYVVVSGLKGAQARAAAGVMNKQFDEIARLAPPALQRPVESKNLRFVSISSAVTVDGDGETESILYGLTADGEAYEYMPPRTQHRGVWAPLSRDGDNNRYTIPGYWKKCSHSTVSVPVLTHVVARQRGSERRATPEEQEAFAREGIVFDGEMGE